MWAGREEKGVNGGVKKFGLAVAENRRALEEWLQRRNRDTCDRYRAQRAIVKQTVKVAKRMADWRWGERLGNDFEGSKKMFWKEVKQMRKGEQVREERVKDGNSQILREDVEVRRWAEVEEVGGGGGGGRRWRRWTEYFQQVLNVEDVREANLNVVGDRMPMLGEVNVRAISIEEVRKTVKEINPGQAPGLDGFPVERLK